MATRSRSQGPAQLDAQLAGWRWGQQGGEGGAPLEFQLLAPDGWKTKFYRDDTKAVAEARRRVRSQPQTREEPLSEAEQDALVALGWRPAGGGLRDGGVIVRAKAPDDTIVERSRAGWRAAIAAGKQAPGALPAHLDPRLPAAPRGWAWESQDGQIRLAQPTEGWATAWQPFLLAGDALDEARAIQAKDAAAVAALAPATAVAAFQPGPDAAGVYRRPPGMAERLMVAPRELVDGRWQPREAYDEAALAELTASVHEHGVLEDLIALVNEYGEIELITGHRRKRAAQAAGGRDVPVRVVEVTEAQAEEIAIISNDQRSDLTDVERGRAYERIIAAQGISEVQLAKRLGRDRTYVQQRRIIARAAPEVQAALTSGEISFTQTRGICQGSGGDHGAQLAALTKVQHDKAKYGTTLSGEEAEKEAAKAVFVATEKDLIALGWSVAGFWHKDQNIKLIYAPTARPAQWSAGEMLAAVREQRRPPESGAPAPLDGPARLDLERRGWSLIDYCAPWQIAQRGKELILGDAGDLAPALAAARLDLTKLADRFVKAGWEVAWNHRTLRATPPAPALAKGKGKAKKAQPVDARGYGEAEKLIRLIEKGEWAPDSQLSQGYDNRVVCAHCGTKTSEWGYVEGDYTCRSCRPAVEAALAARQAAHRAAIEAQIGAWLAAAPPLAAAILLCYDREPLSGSLAALEGPQRRMLAVLAETAWRQREELERNGFSLSAPATAVAALALPEPPAPLTFDQITANLDLVAERQADGVRFADDEAFLQQLAAALDDLIAELSDAQYDGTIARIGELLSAFDGGPA